jgi:protein TonB
MAKKIDPAHPASCEHLFESEQSTSGSFRLGLLAAVAIHLVVFAITWPSFAKTEGTRPPTIVALKLQPVKYIEPPPPEHRYTTPPRRVPIPDPDPQGPEPIRVAEPESVPVAIPEDVVPYFPDAPPAEEEPDPPIVVNSGVEVEAPRALRRVEPRYTEAARRIRYEGAVILSLLIDTEGQVADVTVLRGLPFGLTESAIDAARQWRFEPSTFKGNRVSVRFVLTIRFKIAS